MNWIIDNWYILFSLLILSGVGVLIAIKFYKLPSEIQIEKVRAWLIWAVVQAESDLGSGTGQLKLAMVYDMFVSTFSWIAKILPFATFSILVDEALEKMRNLLESNTAVASLVNGDYEK